MSERRDIKELGRKIAEQRRKEKALRGEGRENRYESALQIGFRITAELLSGVLVGTGIGLLLDWLFGAAPIFLVIFLLLGGAAGLLNVYRLSKAAEAKEDKE